MLQDDRFNSLDGVILEHEACNNSFFEHASRRAWNTAQLKVFCPNYCDWIREFPAILALLIANSPDPDFRYFLTQILYSELGSGDASRMHFILFERIAERLGLSKEFLTGAARVPEARHLIEGMKALYRDERILIAMGAQYALERQAFPMIEKLYAGFKHYDILTPVDFEYFELHLVEEPEHLACMQRCMHRSMETAEAVLQIEVGAKQCLDLIAAFWRRMHGEVMALEKVGI